MEIIFQLMLVYKIKVDETVLADKGFIILKMPISQKWPTTTQQVEKKRMP